ncbi:MAG TPA: tetratricopeptide repeat protein, partial [Bacteroidia bacterium]|nr:tetratricopeptide repeat protein [Bacteroidia bacterium]
MKQILTIILMFFYLISCSSTDEKESSNEIKKPVKSSQKKLHITPKEYEVIKKLKLKPALLETDSGSFIMQIPLPLDKLVNEVFKIDMKVYYRGTRIQFRNAYTDAGFPNNDKQVVTNAMADKLESLLSNCDSQKYCNDRLVDEDNDGIIDYIPLPKKSDSMSCYVHLNSDGTQNYIECNYQDKESRTIKRSIDDNENGYPNQFIYYDPQKETKTNLCITKIDYDANNNRRLDKWDYYENCKLVRREIDENENGTVEEITYYNKKGEYDRFWSIGGDNVKKASVALEAKKYDEAIRYYQAANQELSKEWGADSNEVCGNLNLIGETYNAAQKFPEAIKTFNQGLALKKCSDWGYTHLSKGLLLAYAFSDNIKMVIKSGIEAAKQYAKTNEGKKNSEIEGLLGYGYYKEKEYQEAYKHLLSALELSLQEQKESCKGEKQCSYLNPFYFSMFGNTCSRLNKNAEGIAYYKKALEFRSQLPPEQVNSFEFALAYKTYISGDPKKAISMNERFLNDKDWKIAALVNHAFFHLALEDLQKANQFMKTAVAAGLKKDDWD